MASNTRFEFASSSPEDPVFRSTYTGGKRGHSGAPLDRSGSLREGNEKGMSTSGSSAGRGGPTMAKMPLLSQYLTLDTFALADQKFTRYGELRRILGVSPAITSEDHSFGSVHSKSLPPVASEELKRFRASVLDTSLRAKECVKILADSTAKLDKYRLTLFSRKRQWMESSSGERSNGANSLKMGNQIHQTPLDPVPQSLEDRTKSGVINKRIRSSMAEIRSEGRNVSLSKQGMLVDKDRMVIKAGSGGPSQVEDKIRTMPAGGDGWDKKMKRKRSVGPISSRSVDGDRDPNNGVQQKLNNELRLRSSDGHGFRSGPSNLMTGLSKMDDVSLPGTPSSRPTSRNDIDNLSLPNDRRNPASLLEREKVMTKANNKLNVRGDGQVGNLSSMPKGKASRVIRMGSNVPANSSNLPRISGALDNREQVPCLNKVQPLALANNRKRLMPTESSSPPVAQWGGQRPQKISRTRRTNLVSPVSNNDEAQMSSEGFSTPENGARSTSVEGNGPPIALGQSISNNSQQFKLKLENVASPAGLSESEESGCGDNKIKEQGTDVAEINDNNRSLVQKVSSSVLPSKKNKILIKDELGDGVRRQGRSGRGSAHMTKERVENIATLKPLRSSRPGFDRCNSKVGRPPTKKQSDRKAFSRPGHGVNIGVSDLTGESDDDHAELLAAANSAVSASYEACPSEFWKTMKPIFAFMSLEDVTYLKQQLKFVEELDGCFSLMFGAAGNDMEGLLQEALPSSQGFSFNERQGNKSDVTVSCQPSKMPNAINEPNYLDTDVEMKVQNEKVILWSQRLLSAIIVEDETAEFGRAEVSCQLASDNSPYINSCHMGISEAKVVDKVESEVYLNAGQEAWKHSSLDGVSSDGSSVSTNIQNLNCLRKLHTLSPRRENDVTGQSESGIFTQSDLTNLDGSQSQSYQNGVSSLQYDYQNMCLDERVLAELHSIDIFPDMELNINGEAEDEVNRDIFKLKNGLYQQLRKKKVHLSKLDKAVEKEEGLGGRELERQAMNKLIEKAYKKLMTCRGSSGHKGGLHKISKQAAIAFVKRTLDRYHKYKDTGKSCFIESPYCDVIESGLSHHMNAFGAGTGESQIEHRRSAAGSVERSLPDAIQVHLVRTSAKHEPLLNRGKKREILLDDVVDVIASRGMPSLGNTLLGGAKGKRSDRDQNKDMSFRSGGCKVGRPSGINPKGECKTKAKPKQKTAQLSMANGLLSVSMELNDPKRLSGRGSCERVNTGKNRINGEDRDSSKESEDPIDLTNLPLPVMGSIDELGVVDDLGGQGEDLSSWLSFDGEGLQDNELMGLEIPMDDLNMIL